MTEKLSILAFGGSLRKGSYNKALLRAAKELVPEEAQIEIFDLARIPIYNQDDEREMPHAVREFKEKIRAADALLIATPEYNYSIPGFLKNAIDWASRPSGDNVFNGKPVAIMGASQGMFGSARAQYHLRQVCTGLNIYLLNRPEVIVTYAKDKFDGNGHLVDQPTRETIQKMLIAFVAWARKFQKATQ